MAGEPPIVAGQWLETVAFFWKSGIPIDNVGILMEYNTLQ